MDVLKSILCCFPSHKAKPPARKAFELRLDEAHKAYQALNAVLDIVSDERQLHKLRQAQKMTGELHYDLLGRHHQAPASPRGSNGLDGSTSPRARLWPFGHQG